MSIDWDIKFGDMLVMASLAGSLIYYAYKSGRFTQSIDTMQREIKELKNLASTIATAITTLAVQDTRLNNQDDRLKILDKRIEDLRRGEGLIVSRVGPVDRPHP